MSLLSEFLDFLKEYQVLGLAIAFVIGGASKDLVNSLVNDLVMPLLNPLIPSGAWREATLSIGPVALRWGSFAGQLLNFLVIALVIFLFAKRILKESKVTKK